MPCSSMLVRWAWPLLTTVMAVLLVCTPCICHLVHTDTEKHPRHTRSQRPAGLYLFFVVSTCLCAGSTFMDMSGSEATASLSESLAVIKRCDGSIKTLSSNGEIKWRRWKEEERSWVVWSGAEWRGVLGGWASATVDQMFSGCPVRLLACLLFSSSQTAWRARTAECRFKTMCATRTRPPPWHALCSCTVICDTQALACHSSARQEKRMERGMRERVDNAVTCSACEVCFTVYRCLLHVSHTRAV